MFIIHKMQVNSVKLALFYRSPMLQACVRASAGRQLPVAQLPSAYCTFTHSRFFCASSFLLPLLLGRPRKHLEVCLWRQTQRFVITANYALMTTNDTLWNIYSVSANRYPQILHTGPLKCQVR